MKAVCRRESPSAYSAFTVNRHHTSIKQACECEIILFELMDNQTGTQFGSNQVVLGGMIVTGIGNIHQLLHGDRIKRQRDLHLATVHTMLQFSQPTDTAYEIDALSERRSFMPRISSKIRLEEIVTSRTPIGSLSLYVPCLAVNEYHFPAK